MIRFLVPRSTGRRLAYPGHTAWQIFTGPDRALTGHHTTTSEDIMPGTLALPTLTTTARRAAEIHDVWAADPEMPDVSGCMADAVRVLAVRAAVYEATRDAGAAALPAPAAVELSGRLLERQFPELSRVAERSGHVLVHGADGGRWEPGGFLHRVYAEAFGPVAGRHWPV
jgi:hypothetical protein